MENNTYSQMIENNIKLSFERNGILDEMRSELHVNVLKMMRGEMKLKEDEPLCGGDMKQRGLLQLLNYLVVDYFTWYGFKHTLETFALETGDKYQPRPRDKLQLELGENYGDKDLPILLQMVMKQTKNIDNKMLQNGKLHIINMKPQANPTKSTISDPPEGNPSMVQKLPTLFAKTIRADNKPSKAFKKRSPSPLKKDIKKLKTKVNVRQAMADLKQETKSSAAGSRKNQSNSGNESSSKSTSDFASSSDDMSSDSDAFADIPNRYYYREREPPERAYPKGYGEEGLYNGPRQSKVRHQPNSRPIIKRKPLKITEMQDDDNKEKKPHCSNRTVRNTNPKTLEQNPLKRSKCLFSMQKKNLSDNALDTPVSKPKCPKTMVSSLHGSTEDSDEDSDDYL